MGEVVHLLGHGCQLKVAILDLSQVFPLESGYLADYRPEFHCCKQMYDISCGSKSYQNCEHCLWCNVLKVLSLVMKIRLPKHKWGLFVGCGLWTSFFTHGYPLFAGVYNYFVFSFISKIKGWPESFDSPFKLTNAVALINWSHVYNKVASNLIFKSIYPDLD